jgi:hypothetical protein
MAITSDSILDAAVITPSATPLAKTTRAVWVGGAGTMTVTTTTGNVVTYSGIAAGTLLPIAINAFTAGSATLVLALY